MPVRTPIDGGQQRHRRRVAKASQSLIGSIHDVGLVRLLHDYPTYGVLALRDFTTPLEMLWLLVGAWLVNRVGLPALIRILTWVFLVALPYLLLFPIWDRLAALPVNVGLQQSVPLLGQQGGAATAAGAGLLFFGLVRPVRWSLPIAAAFAAPVLMIEMRGLFLALPIALLFLFVIAGVNDGDVRKRVAALLVAAVVALPIVFALAPSGRLGPVEPSFVASQLGTLLGVEEGPGSNSIDTRLDFIRTTDEVVRGTPVGWLLGVGLGPDLTGGLGEVRSHHSSASHMTTTSKSLRDSVSSASSSSCTWYSHWSL